MDIISHPAREEGLIRRQEPPKGIDSVITDEPQHWHHTALEGAINVVYCGYCVSEQLGVKEVEKVLAERFGVVIEFIDEPTLV